MKKFTENAQGVHLMGAIQGEHSVCGLAFDAGASGDNEDGDLLSTNKTTVTCPNCIMEILNCREVRIKK